MLRPLVHQRHLPPPDLPSARSRDRGGALPAQRLQRVERRGPPEPGRQRQRRFARRREHRERSCRDGGAPSQARRAEPRSGPLPRHGHGGAAPGRQRRLLGLGRERQRRDRRIVGPLAGRQQAEEAERPRPHRGAGQQHGRRHGGRGGQPAGPGRHPGPGGAGGAIPAAAGADADAPVESAGYRPAGCRRRGGWPGQWWCGQWHRSAGGKRDDGPADPSAGHRAAATAAAAGNAGDGRQLWIHGLGHGHGRGQSGGGGSSSATGGPFPGDRRGGLDVPITSNQCSSTGAHGCCALLCGGTNGGTAIERQQLLFGCVGNSNSAPGWRGGGGRGGGGCCRPSERRSAPQTAMSSPQRRIAVAGCCRATLRSLASSR
mmetsp:Transcript_18354/g.52569  ORF Transcript_18354/g.52569 Transcript_18354/m.52569 type:complete len:374 (-) Transcript_18354:2819-3940(-)